MNIETLNPYQRFQLEKYGNIIDTRSGLTITSEQFECNEQDREDERRKIDAHFELELLTYQA